MSKDVIKAIHMPDGTQLEVEMTQAAPETVKVLRPEDQAYLNALNTEVIYAQKAYLMALDHMRRVYNAPEDNWALRNIQTGFERVSSGVTNG